MKMKPDAFEALLMLFKEANLLDIEGIEAKRYRSFGRSEQRYRWDRLWALPRVDRDGWFKTHGIYSYLNDDHIDTALRVIFSRQWRLK